MDDDFFDDHGPISTSPELERASAYYARKEDYAKAAHAALYSGFVQQHYDEKEAAMHSFKEAEQYGKLAVDSLTVARAEYWMGKMLYDDYMEDETLLVLKTADKFFGTHLGERALIKNLEAAAYMVLKQFDSADLCLRTSLAYAEQSQFSKAKRKALNNYAVLSCQQEKYSQAVTLLKQIADEPGLTNTEETLLYLNLGKTFAAMEAIDSAATYYQHLKEFLPSIIQDDTKVSVYGALYRFAESQGDADFALQCLKMHEKFMSKIQSNNEEKSIFRIKQQYDYESLQNVMNKKIIQRHITILIISILLLITTILILFLQYRHKQLLKSEEEMKQQLDGLKQDLLQTVKTSVLDHEISTRLRLILKVHDKALQGNDPKKEWQSLAWQIMNGEQEAFEAARSVLETAYPKLYSTIKENYPDLTETEAKICLLSCSDLSNTEIAELLGLSTNTVNQNRSNLRKKLNLKPDRMKEQIRSALSK
jgi:tetratricopeptide (TPR) repeat protein